jgi:hypothetical protein
LERNIDRDRAETWGRGRRLEQRRLFGSERRALVMNDRRGLDSARQADGNDEGYH